MAKNKLTKFAEMATYNNVFEYTFQKLQTNAFPLKGKWRNDYFKNDNPIVLELGCGKGEYTVGLARCYPNKNFIGMDIKGARMWSGATDASVNNLKNVAFVRTHIEMITHFFDLNEVSEIWITFPDPQMKKVNKRLTSCRFMKKYSEIIKDNGIIHLKTDSNFLYTYTKAMADENQLNVLFDTDDLYNSHIESQVLSIKTFYEKQWLSRGLNIKYLKFICPKTDDWAEPDIVIERDEYRSFCRFQI
ncbi:MAG: tRNA (guanosine(46)-N7)-methyltransferase TrmB [Dysgonamonadaceae bacterium]|nr:tRNA (guanosine(46)-N7)-methyltransferase TrmB [Dysgonamonadaceae bacterium]MDD4728250.1 tRNA (guanosine(46)-N7)-methyltransferase TrmB [Dysgonamonadaceae bacterium]